MFNEWYQPNCELDFPVGGSQGMVDALVAGLRKHGGALRLGAHVEEILVESGEARGVRVRYRNGGTRVLRAKKAVVKLSMPSVSASGSPSSSSVCPTFFPPKDELAFL